MRRQAARAARGGRLRLSLLVFTAASLGTLRSLCWFLELERLLFVFVVGIGFGIGILQKF